MKINISKYAAGASMLTYTPLPDFPSQGVAPTAPIEPVDDSELKAMIGKALTNDAHAYASQYNALLNQYEAMPSHLKSTVQGRMIRNQLKGNWNELNSMANAKAQLDRITVEKKDSLSEFAVFQGHVVAKDVETGDIVNLTLGEYSRNMNEESPKYKALTNGELVDLRSTDPRFVGNNNVLPVLNNAISTEAVVKNIRAALQNLGSFSKGSSDVSYEQQRIEEGANAALNQGMSYVKTSSGDMNESNAENIKMAGNAMWGMLDDASKDLLRVKAIHYGYKPEQVEGAAIGLALALLKPGIREKIIDKSGEALGKHPNSSSSSSKEKNIPDSWFSTVARFSGKEEPFNLITGKNETDKSAITSTKSINFGMIRDEERNGIILSTLSDDKMAGIRNIADFGQVTFGDQILPVEKLAGVIYEGGDLRGIMLPVKSVKINGETVMTPDFDRSQNYADAQTKIAEASKMPGFNKMMKIQIYEDLGFDSLDANGDPTAEEVYPFLVTSALTTNGVVNPSDLVEMSKEDDLLDYYNKYFSDRSTKQNPYEVPYPTPWFRGKAVRGNIFIPLKPGAKQHAVFAGKDNLLVPEEMHKAEYFMKNGLGFNGPAEDRVSQSYNDFTENRLNQ